MKIIDTHLHFWDLGNKINSWVLRQTEQPFFNKSYLPESLFNIAKLDGIVHIEAHDSTIPTLTEIEWLNTIMQKNKGVKYAHIAFADITLPNNKFCAIIDQIMQYQCVKGIRHILSHHPNYQYNPCDEDLSEHINIQDNLSYLSKNNLIFNCQMYPYQLSKFIDFVEIAQVKCIVDHMALPVWNNQNDCQIWKNVVIKLSKMNNVFIKLSGLDMFKHESEFTEIINYCINNVPHNRLLYGSNYPVSCNSKYTLWQKHLNKLIHVEEDKELIFFENANNLFFNEHKI